MQRILTAEFLPKHIIRHAKWKIPKNNNYSIGGLKSEMQHPAHDVGASGSSCTRPYADAPARAVRWVGIGQAWMGPQSPAPRGPRDRGQGQPHGPRQARHRTPSHRRRPRHFAGGFGQRSQPAPLQDVRAVHRRHARHSRVCRAGLVRARRNGVPTRAIAIGAAERISSNGGIASGWFAGFGKRHIRFERRLDLHQAQLSPAAVVICSRVADRWWSRL